MLSASSYGHCSSAKEFRSQCKVLCFLYGFVNKICTEHGGGPGGGPGGGLGFGPGGGEVDLERYTVGTRPP